MIAAWEVVVVLVPLCSASAWTGYAYARRLEAIERLPDEFVEPAVPHPVVAPVPSRPERGSPAEDAIDLSERRGPFGPARSKPAS